MTQTTEVTTVSEAHPAKVVRTTKTVTPPEHFEEKKVIFRTYQIIWYLLGIIEALLAFRIVLKALAANPGSGFVDFIYSASYIFAAPFLSMFRSFIEEGSVFEFSTLVAMIVYFLLAYGLVELFQLIKPTTPEEVEEKV